MHDGELLPILLGGATSEMRNLKPHLSSQQGFSVPSNTFVLTSFTVSLHWLLLSPAAPLT